MSYFLLIQGLPRRGGNSASDNKACNAIAELERKPGGDVITILTTQISSLFAYQFQFSIIYLIDTIAYGIDLRKTT